MPPDPFDDELATARDGLHQLVRRLRSLSAGSWREREEAARSALAGFVALGAQLEGAPSTPPSVATHVLPDAIAVVAGDALEAVAASGDRAALTAALRLIETALAGTR